MSIEVDLVKRFPSFVLSVKFRAENERLGILGASGCGKSMTLRCIAGTITPDEGLIRINDRIVFDSARRINLPPQKRNVGYLFQHYALFPTMTVRQNMEIVLKNVTKNKRRKRVDEMLAKLRLSDFGNRKPDKLSGGEQQRIAMGRMLLSSPEIIMLDEPLSALDSFLQSSIEAELMETLADFQKTQGTVLFVSHSRDEIYRICQRMLVLQDGKMTAFGTTEELFHQPGTVAAARLTGVKNIAPCHRMSSRTIAVPAWGITLNTIDDVSDDITYVGIRAHHICEASHDETENCFDFRVEWKQSEPFRIQQRLFAVSPERFSGECERTALIRFISGASDPLPTNTSSREIKRLMFPAEHVMLLR